MELGDIDRENLEREAMARGLEIRNNLDTASNARFSSSDQQDLYRDEGDSRQSPVGQESNVQGPGGVVGPDEHGYYEVLLYAVAEDGHEYDNVPSDETYVIEGRSEPKPVDCSALSDPNTSNEVGARTFGDSSEFEVSPTAREGVVIVIPDDPYGYGTIRRRATFSPPKKGEIQSEPPCEDEQPIQGRNPVLESVDPDPRCHDQGGRLLEVIHEQGNDC